MVKLPSKISSKFTQKNHPEALPDTGRRRLITGVGALVASSWIPLGFTAQSGLRVGVVGGGIVGCSIALHLAGAGAQVTLFEKSAPAAGATKNSFAWINAATTNNHYRNLRLKSIAGWHQLDQQLGLGIIWGGALEWQPPGGAADTLRDNIIRMQGSNYPFKEIDAEQFLNIAPELIAGDIGTAAFSSIDGHLNPVEVTKKLLQRAQALGVEVKMPCSIDALIISGDQLRGVQSNLGEFELDRLVIATGINTPTLTSEAGFTPKMLHDPGILVHTSAVKFSTNKVVYAPGVHFKQFANGQIVGSDSAGPPHSAAHQQIRQQRMAFPSNEIESMHSTRIIKVMEEYFPVAKQATPLRLTLGYRPMPADRYPIVGFLPSSSSVYVAVMHSGVTLAPAIGQMVSNEIMQDSREADLAPYRPERPGLT